MTNHCKTENTETHHQDDRESDARPAAALSALGASASLVASGCGGGSGDLGTGTSVSGTGSTEARGAGGPGSSFTVIDPMRNASQPVGVLRVIHSFDPCLSCAVHVMRPNGKPEVIARAGIRP